MMESTVERIVVLNALTYAGNLESIKDLLNDSRLTFIHGDICDQKLVEGPFLEYKVIQVVHFAAESHVDRSVLDPSAFMKTNQEWCDRVRSGAYREFFNTYYGKRSLEDTQIGVQ